MNKKRRKELSSAIELLEQAKDIVENCQCEEQESMENLPEGLQYSEMGDQMQNNVDELESAVDDLQEIIDNLQEII